ncbi:MAG: ribbon-helix-helix domain-containing protein [Thermoplasmataceae archaeon]
MKSESKDTKITMRISEEELSEIDSFLNHNPKYGNRSEFLRNSALEFIANNRIKLTSGSQICMDIAPAYEEILNSIVEEGYFRNTNELISAIIARAFDENLVKELVRVKKASTRDLKGIMGTKGGKDEGTFEVSRGRRRE